MDIGKESYLNTSHVIVQLEGFPVPEYNRKNLNTSHVIVQLTSLICQRT